MKETYSVWSFLQPGCKEKNLEHSREHYLEHYSGKLKLAYTSPNIILTGPKMMSRIELTVLL